MPHQPTAHSLLPASPTRTEFPQEHEASRRRRRRPTFSESPSISGEHLSCPVRGEAGRRWTTRPTTVLHLHLCRRRRASRWDTTGDAAVDPPPPRPRAAPSRKPRGNYSARFAIYRRIMFPSKTLSLWRAFKDFWFLLLLVYGLGLWNRVNSRTLCLSDFARFYMCILRSCSWDIK